MKRPAFCAQSRRLRLSTDGALAITVKMCVTCEFVMCDYVSFRVCVGVCVCVCVCVCVRLLHVYMCVFA